jgi:hypothetical protein
VDDVRLVDQEVFVLRPQPHEPSGAVQVIDGAWPIRRGRIQQLPHQPRPRRQHDLHVILAVVQLDHLRRLVDPVLDRFRLRPLHRDPHHRVLAEQLHDPRVANRHEPGVALEHRREVIEELAAPQARHVRDEELRCRRLGADNGKPHGHGDGRQLQLGGSIHVARSYRARVYSVTMVVVNAPMWVFSDVVLNVRPVLVPVTVIAPPGRPQTNARPSAIVPVPVKSGSGLPAEL